jgi:hypothetical protein
MKFSLPAVIAATCAAPAVAEIYMKEQFNDDVSEKILPIHYQRSWWSSFSLLENDKICVDFVRTLRE